MAEEYTVAASSLPSYHRYYNTDPNVFVDINDLKGTSDCRFTSEMSSYSKDKYLVEEQEAFDKAKLFPGTYAESDSTYPYIRRFSEFLFNITDEKDPYVLNTIPSFNREFTPLNASKVYTGTVTLTFYPSRHVYLVGETEVDYGDTYVMLFALIGDGGDGGKGSSSTASDGTVTRTGGGGGGGGSTIYGILDLTSVKDGAKLRFARSAEGNELEGNPSDDGLFAREGGTSSGRSGASGGRGCCETWLSYISYSQLRRPIHLGSGFYAYVLDSISGGSGGSGGTIKGNSITGFATSGSNGSSVLSEGESTDKTISSSKLCQFNEGVIHKFELTVSKGGSGNNNSFNGPGSGGGGGCSGAYLGTDGENALGYGRGGSSGGDGEDGALFLWW